MTFFKWFIGISIVLAALWFGTTFFTGPKQDAGAAAAHGAPGAGQAMPVKVSTLQPQDIHQWHEFSGKLVAVDTVDIRPRVGGMIEEIYFKPGAVVEAGTPLFLIDPRPYQAEVNRASAALTSAKAQASLANSVATRANRLIKENAIAQRDFDERQNAASVAQANIKSAAAALEQAKLNLDYATIKAPITGKISRAEITTGNLVEAGPNAQILATMVSVDSIFADFDIDEQTYLANVRTNSTNEEDQNIPVELILTNDNSAVPYPGKVVAFDNKIDPTAGTIRARAIFANKDTALVPGMFAKIRLGSATTMSTILIPERVINTDQDKKFVYVVGEDNKVEYRPIQLGQTAENMRIVLSGLNAGDRVITNSLMKIRPEMPIQPQETPLTVDEEAQALKPVEAGQE